MPAARPREPVSYYATKGQYASKGLHAHACTAQYATKGLHAHVNQYRIMLALLCVLVCLHTSMLEQNHLSELPLVVGNKSMLDFL